ncbi:hypothetical protein V6N13_036104 [Hibiscus sabdariffa]
MIADGHDTSLKGSQVPTLQTQSSASLKNGRTEGLKLWWGRAGHAREWWEWGPKPLFHFVTLALGGKCRLWPLGKLGFGHDPACKAWCKQWLGMNSLGMSMPCFFACRPSTQCAPFVVPIMPKSF